MFLGQLDELADFRSGACAADDDGQDAAVLRHSVTPMRRAKSSAWRWTLSGAVVIRSRTRRRAAGRHTGNTFAASSGARLRDLMARMGHDSERAAMIYQHEARGADQAITNAIDSHVQAEQRGDEDDDRQAGALAPVG